MLKEGVACGGIMLNTKQFIRSIPLLREDLWFFYMKKMNVYIHARIQLSIKLRKKLGLFTAELFPHGFLFTSPGVEESLYMVESRLKRKRQVQAGYSLKTDRILFF
ncbi:hypothetical protein [Bacillus infantis]|uniref:Uncharacterized protein n=1 Tax=Bacillus infantis TaxID=324767 RepID=A0A5D4R860_9BACI|nr:hypothetical protein [Bacillus infantis]TYS46810.1 hypothetical protein FZD51_15180 [Bacillus infantis]